jgi:hypothetical protein
VRLPVVGFAMSPGGQGSDVGVGEALRSGVCGGMAGTDSDQQDEQTDDGADTGDGERATGSDACHEWGTRGVGEAAADLGGRSDCTEHAPEHRRGYELLDVGDRGDVLDAVAETGNGLRAAGSEQARRGRRQQATISEPAAGTRCRAPRPMDAMSMPIPKHPCTSP